MTSLRNILQRRDAVRSELQSIHAAHPSGVLPADAESRWTALSAEADSLAAAERRQATLDDMDRRAAGQPVAGGDRHFDAEARNFSITRAIAGAAGLRVDDGREREISAEVARRSGRAFQGIAVPFEALSAPVENRVFTTGLPAGGPGSNLIATNVLADQFVDRLRAQLVIRQLGATVLSGLTGNVAIPRLKGSATAQWVAENTAVTASDPQTDQITLTPKTAGAITEFSRNLLLQASPDVQQLVTNDLAAVLAQALDSAAISGPGTGNAPRGILSTTGIGSVALGTNGGALGYDNVVDLTGTCQDANAEKGNAFLTNYRVRRAALKLKDAQGRPYGEDVIFQGAQRAYTTNVPNTLTKGTGTGLSALIYGDFSQLLIGLWSALDILVNPFESSAYPKGNVQVRALMTCDVSVRHPESFAAISDIVA